MPRKRLQLAELFNIVLSAMQRKRQDINALDTFNGNHGDNMVQNIKLIKDAVESSEDASPSEALKNASQKLRMAGQGGTSQYYANGLNQVAELFSGLNSIGAEDAMTLVETLMGSIPAAGHPGEGESVPSVLEMVASLSGKDNEDAYAEGMGQIGDLIGTLGGLTGLDENPGDLDSVQPAGMMEMFTGLLGGQQGPEVVSSDGFGLDDILQHVLPVGLEYLQSRQDGADGAKAHMALVRALLGSQPDQVNSPREGAARVFGQSILEYLLAIR